MLKWFADRLAQTGKKVGKEEKGFTLIELLVVVIIIGILAAIAIPTFLAQRENAAASTVESDVRNAQSIVAVELTDQGNVPTGTFNQNNPMGSGDNTFTPSANVSLAVAGDSDAYTITGTHSEYGDINVQFDSATGATDGADT